LLVGCGFLLTECGFTEKIQGKSQTLAAQLTDGGQGFSRSRPSNETLGHAGGIAPHR